MNKQVPELTVIEVKISFGPYPVNTIDELLSFVLRHPDFRPQGCSLKSSIKSLGPLKFRVDLRFGMHLSLVITKQKRYFKEARTFAHWSEDRKT